MSRDYNGGSSSSSSRRRMEPMGYGGARVYVGDIGNRIGRVDLQREFEQYGQVLDVWMTPYNESRLQDNKFAFVVFRHPEDAAAAVREKRQVCGRKVRVEHAKPPKSQTSRDYQRGGGYRGRGGFSRGGGGGGGYYNSMGPRQPLSPRMNRQRQRSLSPRDRDRGYRRSPPSNGAPRNRRPSYEEQHHYQDRNRGNSYNDYSPDRRMKRPASFSPEDRPKKQSRSSRQDSRSRSPLSPPRQPRPQSDNSVASRSLSPPPKKLKKKKKKSSRRRSMSASPASSPEPQPPRQPQQQEYYNSEEGEYEKSSKSHKVKKSKSSKRKKREMESGEDYSSDDSY